MDTRIRLEILLDIGLCLFPADAEILAQTERTDAVYDTEVDRLRISSLQRCYLFKRHMEHFRCRHAVDILRLAVRLDQVFIARHMGQHAELNLGIVGIQKDTARLWHEGFPDQTAKLHPHRNVPSFPITACRPSAYVDFSLASWRYSRISATSL